VNYKNWIEMCPCQSKCLLAFSKANVISSSHRNIVYAFKKKFFLKHLNSPTCSMTFMFLSWGKFIIICFRIYEIWMKYSSASSEIILQIWIEKKFYIDLSWRTLNKFSYFVSMAVYQTDLFYILESFWLN